MPQNMKRKTTVIGLLAASCIETVLSGCAANEKQTAEPTVGQEISAEDIQTSKPAANESMINVPATDGSSVTEPSMNESDDENKPQTDATDTPESVGVHQTLYEQFLNNEVAAVVRSTNPNVDYMEPIFAEDNSYTLTELGVCVSEYFLNPEYTDKTSYDHIQYTYVDCPDSTNADDKNMLVKFIGLNIYAPGDDSYAVFVITEEGGQLYVTGEYQCWARSETTAYTNGTLQNFGSGGAGVHGDDLSVILSDGHQERIYVSEILSGWYTHCVCETIYNEIFDENADGSFMVSIYDIGDNTYYQYDMSECSEAERPLCEDYINRCRDEQGIHWVTEEEIKTAIKEQCSLIGVDCGITEQRKEAIWSNK